MFAPPASSTAARRAPALFLILLTGCSAMPPKSSPSQLALEVAQTERAFALTMARRDHASFGDYISAEAIFFTGPVPLRGKAAVVAGWKRFYEKPEAPFSWEPAEVEVLESGTLAISSGPVRNPAGKQVATFTSIWRLESPGTWRVIFDKGNEVCDCPKAP